MKTSAYQIQNAIDVLNRLGLSSREELENELPRLKELERWLEAEANHKQYVETWLRAEQQWHHHQWVVNHLQAFSAAKAGWLKMRDASPRLDGVANFEMLGIGLQQRYARFALGVLESIGITDESAWSYIDPGDDS